MSGRSIKFTSDPRQLAAQLEADFQELAEAASHIGQRGDERLDRELLSLYHATSNMASRVDIARAALADAHKWHEPPEWEVTEAVQPPAAAEEEPRTGE